MLYSKGSMSENIPLSDIQLSKVSNEYFSMIFLIGSTYIKYVT